MKHGCFGSKGGDATGESLLAGLRTTIGHCVRKHIPPRALIAKIRTGRTVLRMTSAAAMDWPWSSPAEQRVPDHESDRTGRTTGVALEQPIQEPQGVCVRLVAVVFTVVFG